MPAARRFRCGVATLTFTEPLSVSAKTMDWLSWLSKEPENRKLLFFVPGTALLTIGLLLHLAVLMGLVRFGGRPAAGVTAVFATIFSVVGFQIVSLGLHAKTYSWSRRFDRQNRALAAFYGRFKLEGGLLLGGALIAAGAAILASIVVEWLRSDLLPLPHPEWASFGATLVIIGCSTVFSALFISAMSMSRSGDQG